MPETRKAEKDPAERVRRLLLSGDNIIKNRDDATRYARARERFVTARQIARDGGLDDSVRDLIERRLAALPGGETEER